MATKTDMKALENMFNDLNQKSGGGQSAGRTAWFKPNPPESDGSGSPRRVRILPQGENNQYIFFSQMVKHFNVSEKPFTCPKTHGEECPVCEMSWKFWKESKRSDLTKDQKDGLARIWSLSKNRETHYLSLLDRSDKGEKNANGDYEFPDGRPKVWSFSRAVREQLKEIMLPTATDEEEATAFDITSLTDGVDVNVMKEINQANNIPRIKVYVPRTRKSSLAFEGLDEEDELPEYEQVDKFVTETYQPALEEGMAFMNREWAKYAGEGEYDGAATLNDQGAMTSKQDVAADIAEAKQFVSDLGDNDDDDDDLPFGDED